MAKTKAQQATQNRWIAKTYDRINPTVPKGKKAEIQAFAANRGESVNGFINRAIDNQIAQDENESQPSWAGSRFYTVYRKKFTRFTVIWGEGTTFFLSNKFLSTYQRNCQLLFRSTTFCCGHGCS